MRISFILTLNIFFSAQIMSADKLSSQTNNEAKFKALNKMMERRQKKLTREHDMLTRKLQSNSFTQEEYKELVLKLENVSLKINRQVLNYQILGEDAKKFVPKYDEYKQFATSQQDTYRLSEMKTQYFDKMKAEGKDPFLKKNQVAELKIPSFTNGAVDGEIFTPTNMTPEEIKTFLSSPKTKTIDLSFANKAADQASSTNTSLNNRGSSSTTNESPKLMASTQTIANTETKSAVASTAYIQNKMRPNTKKIKKVEKKSSLVASQEVVGKNLFVEKKDENEVKEVFFHESEESIFNIISDRYVDMYMNKKTIGDLKKSL